VEETEFTQLINMNKAGLDKREEEKEKEIEKEIEKEEQTNPDPQITSNSVGCTTTGTNIPASLTSSCFNAPRRYLKGFSSFPSYVMRPLRALSVAPPVASPGGVPGMHGSQPAPSQRGRFSSSDGQYGYAWQWHPE
jgi:hypothetical protein